MLVAILLSIGELLASDQTSISVLEQKINK